MSNPYDGMAGAFAAGNELAMTAFISATAACVVFPELLAPLPQIPKTDAKGLKGFLEKQLSMDNAGLLITGLSHAERFSPVPLTNVPIRLALNRNTDPGLLLQAASAMHESGMAGGRARDAVDAQLRRVNQDTWAGDDADVFTRRLDHYTTKMTVSEVHCVTTAAFAGILGSLCFIYICVSAALAVAIAAIAVAILACMAMSWAFGVSASLIPPLRTAGTALVNALKTAMKTMDAIMAKVSLALCLVLSGLTVGTAGFESVIGGNVEPIKDLGGSAVNTVNDLLQRYLGIVEKPLGKDITPRDDIGVDDRPAPPDLTPPPYTPPTPPEPGPSPTPPSPNSPPPSSPTPPSPTPTPRPAPGPV